MPWQLSINVIKIIWYRFEQHYGPFTMSIVEESSEIALFRHLSNHVFAVRKFGNTKSMRIIVFFQNFQELIIFLKKQKKIEKKFFCFWDNCIWIGIFNLSLLGKGYISSASNVLTSSPETSHANKRDFFQLKCLETYQWVW